MQTLYGDFFRDNRNKHRHDFFPLDIRRVKRRSDANYPGRQITTPLLEKNETLVRYPWHIPEDQGKDLPPTDPWAVTAEQRRKRDIPVRRHPPAQCCKDKNQVDLLPVDDSIWREEVQDDDYGRWKYFVTNIHGGTLLINGKEIKKNQIAGPLPEFAVIECPGKQVAFWWGPGGRNYLQGQPGYDHEHRWETLRRSDPDLEKVALTAGQEWDYKIRVRIAKEFTGSEWEDDKQWDEWKKAVGVSEQDIGCDPASPAGSKYLPLIRQFRKSLILNLDSQPTSLSSTSRNSTNLAYPPAPTSCNPNVSPPTKTSSAGYIPKPSPSPKQSIFIKRRHSSTPHKSASPSSPAPSPRPTPPKSVPREWLLEHIECTSKMSSRNNSL